MKLGVYGCSFSYGARSNDYVSWADKLIELRPEFEIDNYSNSGSSLMFAVEVFESTRHLYDRTIFQVTFPFRRTRYKLNDVNWTDLLIPNNKQRKFDMYEIDQIVFNVDKEELTMINPATEYLNHRILVEYTKNHADFVFGQYRYDEVDTADIPYVDDVLTAEQIESFKSDNQGDPHLPGHFNSAGAYWMAQWIDKQIDF